LVVLVAVQLSVFGLYRPPVLKLVQQLYPPQTIISLPVQTAVCEARVEGALSVVTPVHSSVAGLYLPPSFKFKISSAPQTIISVPVQTAL
jgi:hypothetical protein